MTWEKEAKFVTHGFINQNFSKYGQQTGIFNITWELDRNAESDSGGLGWGPNFYKFNKVPHTYF